MTEDKKVGAVLVNGGGIAGVQSALDLADSGFKVYLVERGLSIGGVMAQLDKTFPTNDCSMCILAPKLVDTGRHPNIEIISNAEIDTVAGTAGNFRVKVKKYPRYIDEEKCNGCGDCAAACPIDVPNQCEQFLADRQAVYRPFAQAIPNKFCIEKRGPAPCKQTCPVHIHVQGYVALIAKGKYHEAYRLIRERNPLPAVCGRVCNHPCEGECTRAKVDEPVSIKFLKRAAADYEVKNPLTDTPEIVRNHIQVAVIGAGPSGLTCAHDLALLGYQPTIFEKLPVAGGMLAVGIPAYRLPKETLNYEIDYIKRLGVDIKLNTPIDDLAALRQQDFKAVYIAIGAHASNKLGVSGEDLAGVYHSVEFLRDVNLGKKVDFVGKKVAVVGGGNSAIDAARTAWRLGAARVQIVYRRTRTEMPADPLEIDEAEHEGVDIELLAAPVELTGVNGKLTHLKCIRMQLGESDASGRRRPVPIPGSEYLIEADVVIPAISQAPLYPAGWTDSAQGLSFTKWGTIKVDDTTLAAGLPGVFAGGDVKRGADTVIWAIQEGHEAATSIDRFIKGQDLAAGRAPVEKSKYEIDLDGIEYIPRTAMPALPVTERRNNFKETETGFDDAMARREAERCLKCGICSECMECVKACRAKAVDHSQTVTYRDLSVGAIIAAPGFEKFPAQLKSEYGFGRFPNVVTSMGFERILSASGPFKGHVVRPGDHKEPVKIAFIQCVGSRDVSCGNDYCSSVCCMYATKEAVIAKEHVKTIQPAIFYMDMRAFGKDFDRYIERAENEYGVRFVRSRVAAVTEDPVTQNLWIKYEDRAGVIQKEEFDLVVLAVGLAAPPEVQALARKLDIKLNKYNFCETASWTPINTSRPGVFVCGAFAGPKDIPETVMQASAAAAGVGELLHTARNTQIIPKTLPEEIDIRDQGPRVGVFVCHCGINISGVINVKEVVSYVKSLDDVVFATESIYTCSQDSQVQIKEAIKEYRLNRVVVASCTPRTHESLFQETIREAGLNSYLFELANIRDQDSWVHKEFPEAATAKAKDLVRMAIAKARFLAPLVSHTIPVNHEALVIGGGLAGMTAALALTGQDFKVHIIEREQELGGNLNHIHYSLDGQDVQAFRRDLINKVKSDSRIAVHTGTTIKKIDGFVGNFTTTVVNGAESKIEHGVVIVANGGNEVREEIYLLGKNKQVITQRDLEEKIVKGKLAGVKNIVMIQCAGSRDDHCPYCSRYCCQEALKNAIKLKELAPGTTITIIYRDIRSYGFYEMYFTRARDLGVLFVRYEKDEKPRVEEIDGKLTVSIDDPLLKDELVFEPDLLVLSVAVAPQADNEIIAQMLKVPRNADGFFLEAHMKLRPVDFATEGIFLCGLAHAPKNMTETIAQATAAAARAAIILCKQEIEVAGKVSVVTEARCVACGVCESVCPYNAVKVNEEKWVAEVNAALCKGCGICSASCRSGAIDVKGFTDRQIVASVMEVGT